MIHIQQRDCSRFSLDSLLSPTHSTQIFVCQAQRLYKDTILSLITIHLRTKLAPWLFFAGQQLALALWTIAAGEQCEAVWYIYRDRFAGITQDHEAHMPDEFFFQSSIRASHARGHGLTITLEDVGEVKPFGFHVELELPAQHMDIAVDLLPYARDQLDIVVGAIALMTLGSGDDIGCIATLTGQTTCYRVLRDLRSLAHSMPDTVDDAHAIVGRDSQLLIPTEGKKQRFTIKEGLGIQTFDGLIESGDNPLTMLIAIGGEEIQLGAWHEAPIDTGVCRIGIGQSRHDLHAEVLEGAGVWERQAIGMWGEWDLRVVPGIANDLLVGLIALFTILPIVGCSAASAEQDKRNKGQEGGKVGA